MADKKKPDLASNLDGNADPKIDIDPAESPAEEEIEQKSSMSEVDTASGMATEVEANDMPAQSDNVLVNDHADGSVEVAKSGGFVPALVGGILAAFLGYFAARTDLLDVVLPDALKSGGTGDAVAALQESEAEQAEVLAAMQAEIAAFDQLDLAPIQAQLDGILADLAPLKAESLALRERLSAFETRLNPLTARLGVLEKRPMTEAVSDTAIEAYEREMAALKDAISSQRADIEQMITEARTLEADAATVAHKADTQATVTRLRVALDNGAAISPILADLTSAGIVVPKVLNATALDGVATMATLSDEFPTAARAALSAARAQKQGGGGLGGFLQRHLGARSVEPRKGNDPDAILSRAEAAVIAAQLAKALDELAELPEVARAKMQPWITQADTRLSALQAVDALAQSLNTN